MTVNNVNTPLQLVTAQTVSTAQESGDAVKEGFDKLMAKMSDQFGDLKTTTDSSTETFKMTAQVSTVTNTDQTVKNNQQTTAADSSQTDKAKTEVQQDDSNDKQAAIKSDNADTQKVQDEVEEKGEELVKDIADEMDVTPEEVEEAMEVLGLTMADLFQPDNLKQVLLNLSGNADELSILTDENLYANLQNLLETVDTDLSQIAEDLGISTDDLKDMLADMTSQAAEAESPATAGEMIATVAAEDAETPEVNLEGMKDYTVSVKKDGEVVQMQVQVDDATDAKSITETVTQTAKPEEESTDGQKESRSSDMGNKEEGNTENAFVQTPVQHTETAEVQTPEPVYQQTETKEIMDQIMEYMKVNLKADTQELEMQLHPASLGTVNVQIASKDGVLTAHFTAQNDTVRAVIETQLIQLKNQFEEQGIKVNAVEVTVANHEYGQNQFSEQNEDLERNQGKTGKKARRINLDELDGDGEAIEEMDDSERIAVEMMQANGNTVDYMA
jgi:flagellar hook-length control protein FliK